MADDNNLVETADPTVNDEPTKPTLRETLEKNFEKSTDEPTPGTPETPAKGRSFTNDKPDPTPEPELPPEYMGFIQRLAPEHRPLFAKADPAIQKWVADTALSQTATFQRNMDEVRKKGEAYTEFDRIITPEVRENYARQKTSVASVVENAIAWDKAFATNKEATAIEYLQAQGVDLDKLYAGFKDGSLYEAPKPEYLTAEQLEEKRQEWEREAEQKRLEEEESRIAQETNNALQSFLSSPAFQDPTVSESRQLAVAREVRILKEIEGFNGTPQQILDEALKRATATSEAFSGLRSQSHAAKPTDINEQMQRVRDAKKASKTISGSPGSGSPVTKSSSLRENLERNYYKS